MTETRTELTPAELWAIPVGERAAVLARVTLKPGNHEPPLETGQIEGCALEWLSYVAGEPWSSLPACVPPTLRAGIIAWNDDLPSDADRDRLIRPWLLEALGAIDTPAAEEARAWLAVDWLVRTYTPAWLDLVPALAPHAATLRGLSPIHDTETARAGAKAGAWAGSRAAVGAAAQAGAKAGAWAGSRAAARTAAQAGAKAGAWAAARTAAQAGAWAGSRAAVGAAAQAGAKAGAWAAVEAAVEAAVSPTVARLQESAVALFRAMCAVGRATPPIVQCTA